jgi:hypothetical protein
MDYLIYVERNAENLQFYLWYIDYVRRWDELPAKDRALSPKWQPEPVETLNLVKEKDRRSLPRSSIYSPVQMNFEKAISEEFEGKGIKSDGCSFVTASARGSVAPTIAEINAQAGLKWQPCVSPVRSLHLVLGAVLTRFSQLPSNRTAMNATRSYAITSPTPPQEN